MVLAASLLAGAGPALAQRPPPWTQNPGSIPDGGRSLVAERDRALDIDADTSGSNLTAGVWSDGQTMWVADERRGAVLAFSLNPAGDAGRPAHGARDSAKDFPRATLQAAGNHNPGDIWSDGQTMWVLDYVDDHVYAYDMDDNTRDASAEFGRLRVNGNRDPSGIWSDGEVMWVADYLDGMLYAYDMDTKQRAHARDFRPALLTGSILGVWSDGVTVWLAERDDDTGSGGVLAYWLHSEARDAYRDVTLYAPTLFLDNAGLWSDGETMWVNLDDTTTNLEAYTLPDPPDVVMANTGDWDLGASAGVVSLELSWDKDDAGHDDADGYIVYLGDPADYGAAMNRLMAIAASEATVSGTDASFTIANDGTDAGNLLHPDTDYLVQLVSYRNPDNPGELHGATWTESRFARAKTRTHTTGADISGLRCERRDATPLASCAGVTLTSFKLAWNAPASPPSPVDHYEVISYNAQGDTENTITKHKTSIDISAHQWNPTTNTWTVAQTTHRYAIRAILQNRAPGATTPTTTITTTPPGGI